jgi:hypothetical protein
MAFIRWFLFAGDIVGFVSLTACAPRHSALAPTATPLAVAVTSSLELTPLDLSPDGAQRLLVRLRYRDATGAPTHLPPGGNVDVLASRGEVQWQPRLRYGDPAAIVRLTDAGPLTVRVVSDIPRVQRQLTAQTDTRAWGLPAVTARALGPHEVVIGWFPRSTAGLVRVTRSGSDGQRVGFTIAASASSLRDRTVRPGAQYTYLVRRPHRDPIDVGAGVPADVPRATSDVLRGKAMWLSFDDVSQWRVDAMLDRAQRAGLRAIELRMCYGEFDEITPERRAVIDHFIDAATARGIAIIAWTVPRAVTFEDLAANVAALAYRTPAGNGPLAIAVDLERGSEFLGTARTGRAALGAYLGRLREAVGARALLIATVEDPALEHLSEADVPYAEIAASADVVQPMVYWRARRAGASIAGMRAQLDESFARIRELDGSDRPIDIGGQTANLGNRSGAPPPGEVAASIEHAQQLGALGEAFYDWDGTSPAQWAALSRTHWAIDKR